MIETVRFYLTHVVLKIGKGQGLVEYALLLVLIALASMAVLQALGTSVVSVFSQVNSGLAP
jgi:Flp pilus assembly pilin Flp